MRFLILLAGKSAFRRGYDSWDNPDGSSYQHSPCAKLAFRTTTKCILGQDREILFGTSSTGEHRRLHDSIFRDVGFEEH